MFVAEARLAFVALPSCRADVWISFPIAGDEAYKRSKGGTIVVLLCMLRCLVGRKIKRKGTESRPSHSLESFFLNWKLNGLAQFKTKIQRP